MWTEGDRYAYEVPVKRFQMVRKIDVNGVSGTGIVLEGVVTASGKCITEWREPYVTNTIFSSFEQFQAIHLDSHPGCSEIVWIDVG
jgi:hypothetical protein